MMWPERDARPILVGLAGGFVGTAAMTVVMELMFRLLPRHQRAPLPPRQITSRLAGRSGLSRYLDEDDIFAATLLAHFGYGSLGGAIYTLVAERLLLRASVKGSLFGLVVWTGSYYGWVPALQLLPPASQWPRSRKILMVVAHLVWGATLAVSSSRLARLKTVATRSSRPRPGVPSEYQPPISCE
jgi:uncharacterized membrane protein YagU involved in acid resistance